MENISAKEYRKNLEEAEESILRMLWHDFGYSDAEVEIKLKQTKKTKCLLDLAPSIVDRYKSVKTLFAK